MDEDSMVGKLFAGRFRIEARLGRGGMGTVYLALHEILNRRFALKVIRRELLSDVSVTARFRREARAASRVRHPRIPEILDFGHDEEGRAYLAMAYVEGRTLGDALRVEGVFSPRRALEVLAQIADALHAAHSVDVLHRDLKPSNILVTSAPGAPDEIMVLDFGLAKIVGLQATAGVSAQGDVLGTAEYLAPERCAGVGDDPRSDIYSLGALGFELLVGHPPFSGRVLQIISAHLRTPATAPSTAAGRTDVPRAVDELILRCLAKKPEERPQSAATLTAGLRALIGGAVAGESASDPTPTLPLLPVAEDTEASPRRWDPSSAVSPMMLALEELTYALRDRELGSAAVVEQLARFIEAIDLLTSVEDELHALEHHVLDLETGSRIRESRLSLLLSQIDHELAVGVSASLEHSLAERRQVINDRIRQACADLITHQRALEDQQAQRRGAAARAATALEARAAALRAALRQACPESTRVAGSELAELWSRAGL
jgi:serine/threonine protein kinase